MLSYILALCLAILIVLCITLRKAYYFFPAKELKRQAETGEPLAVTFWSAVTYGASLRIFLGLVLSFASALCLLLLARVAPPLLGFVAVALLIWMAVAWLPSRRLVGFEVQVAELLTPAVVWCVSSLEPVLQIIARYLDRQSSQALHTGVYAREDLLELIEKQKEQAGNRIGAEELDIAAAALRFSDKKVRDIMVARSAVKTVAAKDTVSPVYLDELHKTLHGCFPVYEDDPNNFVGVLYLRDLTDVSEGKGAKGLVKDHMSRGVVYVHENDTLADALHAFYLSKKPLFIVVNGFEEYLGIITIEDMLHALLGKPQEATFDQYENKKAVAGRHTKKPQHIDEEIDESAADEPAEEAEPETPPVPTDEVVE